MPEFTVKDWLTICGFLAVSVAGFVSLKAQSSEILRQVEAMHKRIDTLSRRVNAITIKQARHSEQIRTLKDTQRFKMPQ